MQYIRESDYNKITQNFNLSDDDTLAVLCHIDEADKNMVVDSLASKLYDKIVAKVADIDYGSIPETKGDITKLENYTELLETINIISNIVEEYKMKPECIDIVIDAIENIKDRTDLWEKAYYLNTSFPIIFYNTIVLSIVSSVSLLISTSIEFIKDSTNEDYQIKFDKIAYMKSKDNILFQNLKKFNDACNKGEVDKAFEAVLDKSKQFAGVDDLTIVSGFALAAIVITIIPIMRELIFFFFSSKQQISDYFIIQAELIQMNSEYVKNNPTMDSKSRKEISKKQDKIAQNFKKIGNALAVDVKTAERKAKAEIAKDKSTKYKITDVIDSKPDSLDVDDIPSGSSLF